jgi:hypothetical protein
MFGCKNFDIAKKQKQLHLPPDARFSFFRFLSFFAFFSARISLRAAILSTTFCCSSFFFVCIDLKRRIAGGDKGMLVAAPAPPSVPVIHLGVCACVSMCMRA